MWSFWIAPRAVVQARLVLEKGVGDGCLQLPSTLPTGNYRLVAYTRYMRNEGEEVFFEKPLAVVNTFVTNETLLTDTLLPAYSLRGERTRFPYHRTV